MLPNDFFPVGSFVEINGGEAQQIEVRQEGGRLIPGRFVGLVVPENLVRHAVIKLLSRGFDDVGAFAELRGRYRKNPTPTNTFWENFCEEEERENYSKD